MLYAVIVAGGSGSRMNSKVPKQFLELNGKPILYHTIQRFLTFQPDINIILVVPENDSNAQHLISTYFSSHSNIVITTGGTTRYQSVQHGLAEIKHDGIVMIHDGVRPFVSKQVMKECIEMAAKHGNAIPCIDIKDSLRKIDETGNHSVLRNQFKAVQTPQTFQTELIKQAMKQEDHPSFTDEASVLENLGSPIHIVQGNEENIKITTPLDLAMAEWIIQHNMLDFINA